MKKFVIGSMIAGILVSAAAASQGQKTIALGASYNDSELASSSKAGGLVSFQFRKVLDNGVVFGTNFDFNYFSADVSGEEDSVGNLDFGGDILLGYAFAQKRVQVYGLVGYDMQALGADKQLSDGTTGATGYGFAYGGGVDWNFSGKWHLGGVYKLYSMSLEGVVDYDYKRAQVSIGYDFD